MVQPSRPFEGALETWRCLDYKPWRLHKHWLVESMGVALHHRSGLTREREKRGRAIPRRNDINGAAPWELGVLQASCRTRSSIFVPITPGPWQYTGENVAAAENRNLDDSTLVLGRVVSWNRSGHVSLTPFHLGCPQKVLHGVCSTLWSRWNCYTEQRPSDCVVISENVWFAFRSGCSTKRRPSRGTAGEASLGKTAQ